MNAPKRAPQTGYLRLARLVAKRDYVRTVRRRGYVVGTLLLPLGVGVLMIISGAFSASGGAGGAGPSPVSVVVVNESAVPLTAVSAAPASLELITRSRAEALLDAGTISAFYVIPASYPREPSVTRVEEAAEAGLPAMEQRSLEEQIVTFALREALLRQAGLSAEDARQITQQVVIVPVTIEGEEVTDIALAASFVVPILFVTLFMVSIFITSGYLLQSVTEEKENRVVEIVLSSVPSLPLMAGKILGLGAAGLTQVLIWLVTALVAIPLIGDRVGDVGDVSPDPAVIVLAVVYFILGYLAYGAIFAAIGAIAPGNREAQQYSGFFGFLAAIPFVLMAAFLTDLSSTLVTALALFPLTAPTAMLLVLGLSEEVPWHLVGASMISLGLFTVLATWASGRIFRATVLLYGARPSLRAILGAVRSPR